MPAPKDPIKNAAWRKRMSEIMKSLPDEVKQKRIASVVKALSGKPRTDSVRSKIGEAQKGKKRPGYIDRLSADARKKLSEANLGVTRTDENRRRISESHKGKLKSEDHKRKISESKKGCVSSRKGAVLSEDTKSKLREAHIGKLASKETRIKMGESHKGEKNPQWKGGISFEPYCPKFDEPFKERVRAFYNYHCANCGAIQNGERLHVHHVTFDKQTCCNNTTPLFVALCHSCHSKSNHNRKYYEKHFAEVIELEYAGKCYLTKEEWISCKMEA